MAGMQLGKDSFELSILTPGYNCIEYCERTYFRTAKFIYTMIYILTHIIDYVGCHHFYFNM